MSLPLIIIIVIVDVAMIRLAAACVFMCISHHLLRLVVRTAACVGTISPQFEQKHSDYSKRFVRSRNSIGFPSTPNMV